MRQVDAAGTHEEPRRTRTSAAGSGSIPDVTDLLFRWNAGDGQALEDLTPFVYNDLRRLAGAVLAREGPGQTLSATALVHEAYLRLIDQRRVCWANRGHFFSAAAHIMHRVRGIVEMKCLAGMTNQEVAAELGLSHATVERDWKFARAWLIEALHRPVSLHGA